MSMSPMLAKGCIPALFVEREDCLALLLAVVFIFYFECVYFVSDLFHRHLRFDCPVRERENDDAYHDGERDDGKSDIMCGNNADEKREPVVERVVNGRMKEVRYHWEGL